MTWLKWPEDFDVLRDYYTDYCTKRFEKLKRLFCDSLGIPYVSSEEIEEETPARVIIPAKPEKKFIPVKFADKCVQRLADSVGEDLIKLSRGSFKTMNNEYGFALTTSKAYKQGKRDKFWFAYRRIESIAKCKEQYYVFGCKDESTMIKLPVNFIEANLDRLNISVDEDGNVTHWHMVFFKSLFSISKYADCAADFVYFEAIFRRNTVCISRKINEEIRKICKQDAC